MSDTENTKDGGDISSGFGESSVDGPVSDEKAQQMLHDDGPDGAEDEDSDDGDTEAPAEDVPSPAEKRMIAEGGPVGEPEQLDADAVRQAGRGNGGSGGGGW
ncbi:MAG: hypothetical protein L0G22_06710 [Propionibacteriaceae bacterium]|nr:hypothetical protein [Propionibacteriaceae bacterium]